MDREEELAMTKQKAAAAGLWSALDVVLRQGVQFVVTVVLARLLAPEDFGIIALVSFFTALSIAFAQSGLTAGLMQRQDTSTTRKAPSSGGTGRRHGLFGDAVAAGPPWRPFTPPDLAR